MLVEDDNNLREIYEARLLAEGYEIVTAQDGEEALALAVKERPDLIIADIMMPKISGFDMLDILRSTSETKSTKIIMMTALSQAEDKERASKLGADRYLVKSQVTLEDVARVAREFLNNQATSTPAPPAGTGVTQSTDQSPTSNPTATSPDPSSDSSSPPTSVEDSISKDEQAIALKLNHSDSANSQPDSTQIPDLNVSAAAAIPLTMTNSDPNPVATTASSPFHAETPVASASLPQNPVPPVVIANPPTTSPTPSIIQDIATKAPPSNNNQTINRHSMAVANDSASNDGQHTSEAQSKTVIHTKVIQPINDITKSSVDFKSLLAKEEAKQVEAGTAAVVVGDVNSANSSGSGVQTITPTQTPNSPSSSIDPGLISL